MKNILLFIYICTALTLADGKQEIKHFIIEENGIEIKVLYPNTMVKKNFLTRACYITSFFFFIYYNCHQHPFK